MVMEPGSDLKSERTRSAFAAAELKAVLAFETKEGASISYASGARIKAFSLCIDQQFKRLDMENRHSRRKRYTL